FVNFIHFCNMPRKAHYFTEEERRKADADRKCKNRIMKTEIQRHQRRQQDAVVLTELDAPIFLKHLFSSHDNKSKDFRYNIYLYNSAFAFTSTGVKINHELANGKNSVYTYRVQGSFHHRIGALRPENDSTIIQNLTTMFDKINPYVINFRYISKLPAKNFRCLFMLIRADIPGLDQRTYNNLTASQVAAIWVNSEMPSDIVQKHDIVLHTNMGQYVHISELNECYDPLAYPILFPYGD
ncbi:15757_t:CDS:2, partial [Cetraspora pellucida]